MNLRAQHETAPPHPPHTPRTRIQTQVVRELKKTVYAKTTRMAILVRPGVTRSCVMYACMRVCICCLLISVRVRAWLRARASARTRVRVCVCVRACVCVCVRARVCVHAHMIWPPDLQK